MGWPTPPYPDGEGAEPHAALRARGGIAQMLQLEGVNRSFGGVRAVSDLTMAVPCGQITGLIGPNGAGKTTVINLIAGTLKLTSGRIILDGADVAEEEPDVIARHGISRTFQNIRLLPEATVLENV